MFIFGIKKTYINDTPIYSIGIIWSKDHIVMEELKRLEPFNIKTEILSEKNRSTTRIPCKQKVKLCWATPYKELFNRVAEVVIEICYQIKKRRLDLEYGKGEEWSEVCIEDPWDIPENKEPKTILVKNPSKCEALYCKNQKGNFTDYCSRKCQENDYNRQTYFILNQKTKNEK